MGMSKNEVNNYLNRKLVSSIQGIIGKSIKSNHKMELININSSRHNRNIDANNKSFVSMAENSFRKKAKDYPNIIQSIESYFSNAVSYKKFGVKSYQKFPRTHNDNTYNERCLSEENCHSLCNRTENMANITCTSKQKSSCPYSNVRDKPGYIEVSENTYIESLCLDLGDDENNNVEVKRKDTSY